MGRTVQRRCGIAPDDTSFNQQIVRPVGMDRRRTFGFCLNDFLKRGQGMPDYGKIGQIRLCASLKRNNRYTFPFESRWALRNRGLVCKGRDDAKPVLTGNIVGGENSGDACLLAKRGKIQDGKGSMGMGRPHRDHGQGVGRAFIRAKAIAMHLFRAINPWHRLPDPPRHRLWRKVISVADRRDNLAIPCATAQNSAQCLLHLLFRRAWLASEQINACHQHSWRANTALRCAMS